MCSLQCFSDACLLVGVKEVAKEAVFCKRVNAVPKFGTPTWTDLGATLAQVEAHIGFKMEDIASPIQNPQSARFHWCFPRFFCYR